MSPLISKAAHFLRGPDGPPATRPHPPAVVPAASRPVTADAAEWLDLSGHRAAECDPRHDLTWLGLEHVDEENPDPCSSSSLM